jgi:ribosomal 50S subunit-associated protein YjgA (DUF615 family)
MVSGNMIDLAAPRLAPRVRLGWAEEARARVSALEQILTESPTAFDELLARFSHADRERLLEMLRAAGWRG